VTLREAFTAARSRRLRPEGYSRVAGAFTAFLLIVIFARIGANLYLTGLIVPPGHGHDAAVSFFRLVNMAWCVVYLASAAAILLFRGIATVIRGRRLAYLPLSRTQIAGSAVSSSLSSVPVLLPSGIALLALLTTAGSSAARGALELLLLFIIALAGFMLLLALLERVRCAEGHLELIEVALLGVMIFANPEFRIVAGTPIVFFFNHPSLSLAAPAAIFLLPPAAALLGAAAVLLSALFGAEHRPRGGRRSTVLVLHRSRIPVALLAVTYAFEIPLILLNPALRTTVRAFVLFLLAVRLVWFFAFLFRAEQRIAEVVRAPQTFRERAAFYSPAAALHAVICALPPLLYLARLAAG